MRILVLGGSQGAKIFAEQLPQIFEKLKNYKIPIKIYQQCQKDQNNELSKFYNEKRNIPFISIPLPTSADNHQYKNAEFYSKKGYGYLIEEKNIKMKLYDLINLIFKDKSLVKEILLKQKQNSDNDVFKNLLIQLKKTLDEKN